jgi:predicted DNA-binding transcriptional regulator AlpA
MTAKPEPLTLVDLQELARAGQATITADEAYPVLGNVSRASFYRAMKAGEVPGVLRLGRKRLLSLAAFVKFLEGSE